MDRMQEQVRLKAGSPPQHFVGCARIRVLEGEISVLGRRLLPDPSRWVSVFSPKSTALLAIELAAPETDALIEVASMMDTGIDGIQGCQPLFAGLFGGEGMEMRSETIVPGLHFLKRHTGSTGEHSLLTVPREWHQLADVATASLPNAPVVLVCGHRKVGKSTFSRFLVNSLLNVHDAVDFFDLDLGQSEFTTAGFVSRQGLRGADALLGPPFTHLCVPDDAVYLATGTPSDLPLLYCRAVATLWARRTERPAVINTMGWVTGLGFDLLQFTMQLFRPTHIVAFMDGEDDLVQRALTTPCPFGEGLGPLGEGLGPLGGGFGPLGATDSLPHVVYMPNPTSEGPRSRFTPGDLRNLSYWSYFFGHCSDAAGGCVNSGADASSDASRDASSDASRDASSDASRDAGRDASSNVGGCVNVFSLGRDRFLSAIPPKIVPLHAVQLASLSRELSLDVAVGGDVAMLERLLLLQLVGLAHDPSFTPRGRVNVLSRRDMARVATIRSVGVGLIRAVETVSATSSMRVSYSTTSHSSTTTVLPSVHLHIVTPLPLAALTAVNTLVFGSLAIPTQLLAADIPSMQGEAPFFALQPPNGAGPIAVGSGLRKARYHLRRQ